mgnify:CR=1 FL=1
MANENYVNFRGVDFLPLYGVWNYIKRNEGNQSTKFIDRATLLQIYNTGLVIGVVPLKVGLEKLVQQMF